MAKAADIGSKRLINLAPDAWVQWVTQLPEVVAKEILGSELQWISRETDVLVKAYSTTNGDFLVLNELQLRYTAHMPLRFGEIPQKVEARLEGQSVEQLETLMDSALAELTGGIAVSSLEEFMSILSASVRT